MRHIIPFILRRAQQTALDISTLYTCKERKTKKRRESI